MIESLLFLIISFSASTVGAICGIGGGVVIKPTLDFFRLASVPAASFLSSCTVLVMSCYSIGRTVLSRSASGLEFSTATPLALGAAAGGVFGQFLFRYVRDSFTAVDRVGAVQSAALAAITLGTLIYTLAKRRVRTHRVSNPVACVLIGSILGIMSSFLGIGGGPINLVVLYYFFSMEPKTAALNSLYVILVSQIASFATVMVTRDIPEFGPVALALMVTGGLLGGIVGRTIYQKMNARAVERLFVALMAIIIFISVRNVVQYLN